MCLSASIWATSRLRTCIPALMHGSPAAKSRNFYPNYRVRWPLPPLTVFCLDVQSSSCPKPPDPLTLRLCHCKQEAGDSGGGGARSGLRTCLMGSLEENKHGGKFSFFYFFSVLQRSPGIYWDKGFCIERRNCSRSSEWLKQPQAERYL